MRTIRIHTPEPLTVSGETVLPPAASNHLVRVLRQGPGAPVTLFNGDNREYAAILDTADPRAARLRITDCRPADRESPLAVHLLAGISKGERMDYTVQKAVELGVAGIQPVFCAATVVRLDADKRERRRAHWQEIAVSACEQCGRNRVPPVLPPVDFAQALTQATAGLRLVLHGQAAAGLRDLGRPDAPVTLLIGPEGGLSAAEIAAAEAAGFRPLRLGPRVLRTETAGVAALAALQALWGDW
ncbi:16S rRNA (uracil(1498)-N(3))-methyltransferase [Thermithiobacillus tepidarius DSM 3134]|uniref:16S rRNA (uracil(1498)-N(3))-methyltransferase n=1 Tax=Thermithiobacillus tepidarius TaxID=929 RepID=UPI000401B2C3|nr:16S rRNA (uracil(1498)-N(3))-methyltransferase [Thermithiobacillus tepidarius]